jgi:hypothetical protein
MLDAFGHMVVFEERISVSSDRLTTRAAKRVPAAWSIADEDGP